MKTIEPYEFGDRVTYVNKYGNWEKGRVKYQSTPTVAFVVYNCNDDWEHFQDYTGAATDIEDLKPGWAPYYEWKTLEDHKKLMKALSKQTV